MTDSIRPPRWYREPWAWFVLAIPIFTVIGGVSMVVFSMATFDGTVEDDYYRRGLEINQDLARDRRADERGLRAILDYPTSDGRIVIALACDCTDLPDAVSVRFMHATRSGMDQQLLMPATGGGRYASPAPALAPGRWEIHIEADDWRLRETLFINLERAGDD